MATQINVIKPAYNKPTNAPTMQSVNGEGVVPYTGGRNGLLLILYSSDSNTITIKGGTGVFAGGDMKVTIGGGENKHLLLEPAPFLQTEGANKGCVVVQASNCMVGAVELT